MFMIAWWQTFPLTVDPTVFTVGSFGLRWYAVMYLLGAGVSIWLLAWRRSVFPVLQSEQVWSTFVTHGLWGVLIGARLGYIIFYGDASYWTEPWRILSPYDFHAGLWTGIRGMSFFGGALGLGLVLWYEARRLKLPFLALSDWLLPVIPVALFFGRLGNFLNQELFGRVTSVPWGMYFPSDPLVLRHPSQLYEAIGEGGILFWVLLWISRRRLTNGFLTTFFLMGYGCIRFGLEFVRAPDPGAQLVFSFFTFGQVLSGIMVASGVWLIFGYRGLWYTERANIKQG